MTSRSWDKWRLVPINKWSLKISYNFTNLQMKMKSKLINPQFRCYPNETMLQYGQMNTMNNINSNKWAIKQYKQYPQLYQMLWTDWINGTIIKLLPKNAERKWINCVTQDLQITKQCDYLTKWIKDATTWDCKTERKYL